MLETSLRLLRLLSLLLGRQDWAGAELADRLGVTTRTVRSDVERLRLLGYQVHSTPGVAGGYRLGAGTAMPPLLLDDEEAVAVAVGLRAAAGGSVSGLEEVSVRALAKLEQTLPTRLRHRVDALRSATVFAARSGPTVDAEVLTGIAAAVRRREQVRFDYVGHDGAQTPRRAEPYRLVYTGRRWYLLAWDTDRADWRTFRADRIRLRPPNGPRFTPREPPEGGAGRHVLRGVTSLAWKHQARVRLHAPAEVIADRISTMGGLLTPVDDDSCLLETGGEDLYSVAGYLGGLGVPFDVLDPPDLRAVLRELADRYRSAAGDGDSAGEGDAAGDGDGVSRARR